MNNQLASKDTALDRIQAFYLHDKVLSEEDREIAERMELAFALFCHNRSRKQTISKYLNVLKAKGKTLSIPQAYRDLAAAEQIFAPIHQYSKEFLRLMIVESAMRDVKRCEDWLNDKELPKSLIPKIMDSKDKAERRIAEVRNLKSDDSNLPDFSMLEPHQFIIDVPKPMLDLFQRLLQQGVVNLNDAIPFDEAEILGDDGTDED